MSFKAFKEFVRTATTRCGLDFEIVTVQKNLEGTVTAVKGNISVYNEKREWVKQEMLWNLKGQAMLIGEQFDLVQEIPFDTVEEDAPVLVQPSA